MSPSRLVMLTPSHLPDLLRLLGDDPVPNVFMIHLARRTGLVRGRSASPFYGHLDARSRLIGAGVVGGTLLACAPNSETPGLLGVEALRRRSKWRSLLGDRRSIDPIWRELQPYVAHPVEDRGEQWLSVAREAWAPATAFSPVRRAEESEIPRLLPLRCAMYEEPEGRRLTSHERERIRRRCRDGSRDGHLFVVEREGQVVFTASFSAATPEVTQISSVFTHPDARGRGIATAALSALCGLAFETSERVSLFVAGENAPALRVYAKLGFRHTTDVRSIRLDSRV